MGIDATGCFAGSRSAASATAAAARLRPDAHRMILTSRPSFGIPSRRFRYAAAAYLLL
jgi:hypothetical protein